MSDKPEIRVSAYFQDNSVYVATDRSLTTQVSGYRELSFTTKEDASKAEADSILHLIVETLFDSKHDDLGVHHIVAGRRNLGLHASRASDLTKIAKVVGGTLRTRYSVVNVPKVSDGDQAEAE